MPSVFLCCRIPHLCVCAFACKPDIQGVTKLSDADAASMKQYAFIYAGCQNAVARHYNDLGHILFDITYKTHALIHVALQAADINPQMTWCYMNEAYMGVMKKLVAACTHGCAPSEVSNRALDRWMRSLDMHYSNM